MRPGRFLLPSILGLAAIGFGVIPMVPIRDDRGGVSGFVPARERHKARGKGRRDKPKKRANRLTISKRVRRKHRRAA